MRVSLPAQMPERLRSCVKFSTQEYLTSMSSAAMSLEPSSMRVVKLNAKSGRQKTKKDLQGLKPKKDSWRNKDMVKTSR